MQRRNKSPKQTAKAFDEKKHLFIIKVASALCFLPIPLAQAVNFIHISSAESVCTETVKRLPCPTLAAGEQTATLVTDVNGDGRNDFIVTNRSVAPSIVWFERTDIGWHRRVIEDASLKIEAGGDHYDIDGDGDPDIAFGGDYTSNQVWWWENPAPNFDKPWVRRTIKADGLNQHHDQQFGDFDDDGRTELVFWNQKAKTLFLADMPDDPKTAALWPKTAIFTAPDRHYEGLAKADIDGDGTVDIVAAGRWFKHQPNGGFHVHTIDDDMAFTRAEAGQIIEGGRPEAVFVCGDCDGPLKLYEHKDGVWSAKTLIANVVHGHSLRLADINGDGHLDIFVAEMRLNGGHPDASIRILYGDGAGNFQIQTMAHGLDNHESRVADLDGDGDVDILSKPYNWQTPRIDVWLNRGAQGKERLVLDRWQKHFIGKLNHHGTHIVYGDFDDDGYIDMAAADSWFKNPGTLAGAWSKHRIGEPLKNVGMARDFNGDGKIDLLGGAGAGNEANPHLVWAENIGEGLKVHTNIAAGGRGDYLQGIALLPASRQIALSWHNGGGGVQGLHIPDKPARHPWSFSTLSESTQSEDLSVGDIDGDGDEDILQGTQYLRNNGSKFTATAIGTVSDLGAEATPDRNDLADINGDGKLDAVVALEKGTHLLWFEQRSPTQWERHVVTADLTGQGFSMDVADFDRDGDPDIVVGEHRGKPDNRVLIFENKEKGQSWQPWLVDSGPAETIDHHDGTQAVDLDQDGDLDLISIGWYNKKVWVFENKALD